MNQETIGELQHYLADLKEELKQYMKDRLSPEVLDRLRKFVDRCDALLHQQSEVNTRYDLRMLQDHGTATKTDGGQDPASFLLAIIRKKLAMLEEARMECVLNGTLEDAEADFCTLEKAYLDLKVDIESFIRLQEAKDRKAR